MVFPGGRHRRLSGGRGPVIRHPLRGDQSGLPSPLRRSGQQGAVQGDRPLRLWRRRSRPQNRGHAAAGRSRRAGFVEGRFVALLRALFRDRQETDDARSRGHRLQSDRLFQRLRIPLRRDPRPGVRHLRQRVGSLLGFDVRDLRARQARRGKAPRRRAPRHPGDVEIPRLHGPLHGVARPRLQRPRPLLGARLDRRWPHLARPSRRLAGTGRRRNRILRGLDPGRSHRSAGRHDPPGPPRPAASSS